MIPMAAPMPSQSQSPDPSDPFMPMKQQANTAQFVEKIRGGMPMTDESMNLLGAGQPYSGGNY